MRQGWCVQRTEPSQRQGLRSSPWRKSDDSPCQLAPPGPTPLRSGRSLSHLRKAQAFHPPQGKRLRLQGKRKKSERKVNFPDQTDEDEKGLQRRWGLGLPFSQRLERVVFKASQLEGSPLGSEGLALGLPSQAFLPFHRLKRVTGVAQTGLG